MAFGSKIALKAASGICRLSTRNTSSAPKVKTFFKTLFWFILIVYFFRLLFLVQAVALVNHLDFFLKLIQKLHRLLCMMLPILLELELIFLILILMLKSLLILDLKISILLLKVLILLLFLLVFHVNLA